MHSTVDVLKWKCLQESSNSSNKSCLFIVPLLKILKLLLLYLYPYFDSFYTLILVGYDLQELTNQKANLCPCIETYAVATTSGLRRSEHLYFCVCTTLQLYHQTASLWWCWNITVYSFLFVCTLGKMTELKLSISRWSRT